MANYDLPELTYLASALADESPVQILLPHKQGEFCVRPVLELLDLAPSTPSFQMALLKRAQS